MIRIELSMLMEKLNPLTKHVLEEAAAICVSQDSAEITVAHVLFSMLDTPYCDVRVILEQSQRDHLELKNLLGENITASKINNINDYPSFSPLLIELFQDAWLLASTEYGHKELRGGIFFLSALMNVNRYLSKSVTEYLTNINRESLRKNFDKLTYKSVEAPKAKTDVSQKSASRAALDSQDSLLDKYTVNFTEQARNDELDPVLCRDDEIALMIDILSRRRKNNPIVVGDAGVGKSAVVEGLALRIVAGDVPEKLQNIELLSLDLGALQAGASIKGEFEKRLKGVIEEVKTSEKSIILFIDEAHTLIGAGNAEGSGDAANLLKPALARGELRTIGATTWKEYKKYFEKDPALSRRFQLVKLEEPTIDAAINIMRGLSAVYEKSHNVLISDDAIKAAVEMSARYISGRQLPDKAIDVLDTACARVAINLSSKPNKINSLQSEIRYCSMEIDRLSKQQLLGVVTEQSRIDELNQEKTQLCQESESLEKAWQAQQQLVAEIIDLRKSLQDSNHSNTGDMPLATESDENLADADADASDPKSGSNSNSDADDIGP